MACPTAHSSASSTRYDWLEALPSCHQFLPSSVTTKLPPLPSSLHPTASRPLTANRVVSGSQLERELPEQGQSTSEEVAHSPYPT